MGSFRRGDVRTALFAFLLERPGHGYEMIQYLEARTNGVWRPSPGSIYPALQLLEDEGLVSSEEADGRRVFALTETGRASATARIEARGTPWDNLDEEPPSVSAMKKAMTDTESAATEVLKSADGDLIARGLVLLEDARKRLYSLLAE